MNIDLHDPLADDGPLSPAEGIARGTSRFFRDLGYAMLREFHLTNGRRVDVVGLDGKGRFVIAEVKSSSLDYRADGKWPEYRPFCDLFYFAVARDFPFDLISEDCGLIVADAYGAAVMPMNAARRRAQVLRFGLAGTGRLERLLDPPP